MKMPILVAIAATALALPATAHAEPTPPCSNGQVQVSNGGSTVQSKSTQSIRRRNHARQKETT